MERIMMKLEVYKQELSAEHNAAMARKVQLQEQTDVNDANLQRVIGALDAMVRAQGIVDELRKADAEIGGLDAQKAHLVMALDDAVKKSADAVKAIRKLPPIDAEPKTGGTT